MPKTYEKLLEFVGSIQLGGAELERIIKRKERLFREERNEGTLVAAYVSLDKNGKKAMIIHPHVSEDEREIYKDMAEEEGMSVIVDPKEALPKIRGDIFHDTGAERYPVMSWPFDWDRYTVACTPDGITREFVYEYKTTKSLFLMYFLKPVAVAQADLYGYFFGRPKKRVHFYVVEEDATEILDAGIDAKSAEALLDKFKKTEEGLKPRPPKPWKCRSCDYAGDCPVGRRRYS